jgi:small redox-active disulfide protein 2
MNIKILGTGCSRCKQLEALVAQVAKEGGADPVIEKVTDIPAIMAYGVMETPGLVVDEQLVASGRIPSRAEVAGWLKAGA